MEVGSPLDSETAKGSGCSSPDGAGEEADGSEGEGSGEDCSPGGSTGEAEGSEEDEAEGEASSGGTSPLETAHDAESAKKRQQKAKRTAEHARLPHIATAHRRAFAVRQIGSGPDGDRAGQRETASVSQLDPGPEQTGGEVTTGETGRDGRSLYVGVVQLSERHARTPARMGS